MELILIYLNLTELDWILMHSYQYDEDELLEIQICTILKCHLTLYADKAYMF